MDWVELQERSVRCLWWEIFPPLLYSSSLGGWSIRYGLPLFCLVFLVCFDGVFVEKRLLLVWENPHLGPSMKKIDAPEQFFVEAKLSEDRACCGLLIVFSRKTIGASLSHLVGRALGNASSSPSSFESKESEKSANLQEMEDVEWIDLVRLASAKYAEPLSQV